MTSPGESRTQYGNARHSAPFRTEVGRSVHPIEVESYRILAERVDLSAFAGGAGDVVARMVHATADVGFAATALVGAEAVDAAVAALRDSRPVIADSAMVAAGITRVPAICLLPDVPAAPLGSTRSAAAFALAAERYPVGALWVVGTAPTALAELLRLCQAGAVEPGAVVGLPVGFVGAVEAKAALWGSPLRSRAITNSGERGGAAVAAAAVNALIRLAEGDG